ncbi:MAG: hypothetical protein K2N88_00235, partial [Muribaculaceae bacterium]|nr:hypothetical protein [Muribaculaceae bacterium]
MQGAKKSQSSFPDFAFPKSVSKTAEANLRKALVAKDDSGALNAAIQLTVASDLVSADSYPASIERFDSLAGVLCAPWSDLALLLEARIYSQVYAEKPWIYSGRTAPAAGYEAPVAEWNREMFASRVRELCDRALADPTLLASLPLSDISAVLEKPIGKGNPGFTVLDFIADCAVRLTQRLQNEESMAQLPVSPSDMKRVENPLLRYVTLPIEAARIAGNLPREAFWAERKLAMLSGDEYSRNLEECCNRFIDTPYYAPFLLARCCTFTDDNDGRRSQLRELDDYSAHFPQAQDIASVKNRIAELKRESVNLKFAVQLMPGVENEVNVSGENLYNYWLLAVKLNRKGSNDNYVYSDLTGGRVVASVPVSAAGSVPDKYTIGVKLPSLTPGLYAIVASRTAGLDGILKENIKSYLPTTEVSGLTLFTVDSPGEKSRVYVVAGSDQHPLEGAKVNLYRWNRGARVSAGVFTTGSEGYFLVEPGRYDYVAEGAGSRLAGSIYSGSSGRPSESVSYEAGVLTDLSLYRPGQKVEFVGSVWSRSGKSLQAASDRKIDVVLIDANYQDVDTIVATTDTLGRFTGRFDIPADHLSGSWHLRVQDNGRRIGEAAFQVAEYKAPTFLVELEKSVPSEAPMDSLVFKGRALTYAGLPVADAEVKFTLEWHPGWWRWDVNPAKYSGSVATGSDGSFIISLPTAGLLNSSYRVGQYSLMADVTSKAGETQSAPALRFALGDAWTIIPQLPETVEAEAGEVVWSVRVSDVVGAVATKKLYYRISSEGKRIADGTFDSPRFSPDLSGLPSGRYEFAFSLSRDFSESEGNALAKDSVIVWRKSDKMPPVATSLWVPERRVIVSDFSKSIRVRVGSSLRSGHILAVISDSKGLRECRWVKIDGDIIEFTTEAPCDDERIYVDFYSESNLSRKSAQVVIIPKSQTEEVKISAVTFRDHITPGANESWKFRFTLNGEPLKGAAAMAVMSDKALSAIVPFRWSFNPYSTLRWWHPVSLHADHIYDAGLYWAAPVKSLKAPAPLSLPEFNTYGYPLYGGMQIKYMSDQVTMTNGMVLRGSGKMMMAKAEGSADSAPAAGVYEQVELEESAVTAEGGVTTVADTAPVLREKEMPLAFFMPTLVTDSEGECELAFRAPDFIGTWQLQLAGYSKDMRGATLHLDAVSAKSVMITLNAPRFVRTGDEVTIGVTLFNNSVERRPVSSSVRVLDMTTGRMLLSHDFGSGEIDPEGSRVVACSLKVPSDVSVLEVQAYAREAGMMDGNSDGERVAVPVLPGTTVETKSLPFYLSSQRKSLDVQLPVFPADASVTLSYCANPVWECVTALPAMLTPENSSIISAADALFGNALVSGLIGRYPAIGEGLRKMASCENASDSALVSPLQKNEGIKQLTLSQTPWVRAAEAETARMAALVDYLTPGNAQSAIDECLSRLRDRQNADGGWSWCPDMPSSSYMSRRVLQTMGRLANLGFLPEGSADMASRACTYIEKKFVADWEKSKKKNLPVTDVMYYLFTREGLGLKSTVTAFSALEREVLQSVQKDWRKMSVYDKATAVIVLDKEGKRSAARQIMESVAQFASENPEKGAWFDNISSDWSSQGALLTTARVLEAYSAIEPSAQIVDGLRQWLVLSKQTQDWKGAGNAAEAIAALLSGGTDWLSDAEMPEISLNGKSLGLPSTSALVGAFTLQLSPEEASGATLSVNSRAAAPSWGGVIASYVLPLKDAKGTAVPQMSVSKSLAVMSGSGKNGQTPQVLKVGDRVRVNLTVTTDRDIDYVAIVDNRAACLEPAEQLSVYTASDGVWYYREVADATTSLLIPHLSKGTHVLSYECVVDRPGVYSLGTATAQSQYAP